jgi:hypothetical protein
MMVKPPDFSLTTAGEYEPLAAPHECRQRARLHDELRDDYMLVDIEPPLPGQRFGLGGFDVTSLVLSSRHRGQTLYPISEWPNYVYVARVLGNENPASGMLSKEQLELIAWGAIFRSLREASDYAASVGR